MDNNNPQHLHISDFNYPLTDERIAKYPLAQRDSSKLLIYRHGEISQDTFVNLPDYLPSGALMVFNNTKVIRARLHFRKSPSHDGTQGALIEIFLLEPAFPQEYQENFTQREKCTWYCLVGNSKKWKSGSLFHDIEINGRTIHFSATRIGIHGTSQEVMFEWDGEVSFSEVLEAMGELPIPPYLNRKTEESDKTTYQTVYSKIKGIQEKQDILKEEGKKSVSLCGNSYIKFLIEYSCKTVGLEFNTFDIGQDIDSENSLKLVGELSDKNVIEQYEEKGFINVMNLVEVDRCLFT